MSRPIVSCVVAVFTILATGLIVSVEAASPPTGSVSCTAVEGQMTFPGHGLPLMTNPGAPRTTKVKLKKAVSIQCDNSGVTGGRFPITEAVLSLDARTAEGETCGDFLGTLDFQKSKITVKWRGDNNYGRVQAIASSKAAIASAVYDGGSERLVIVTQPIEQGAFAGSTLTFRVSFPEFYVESCTTNTDPVAYSSFLIGTDGASTIEVP